MVRHLSLVRPSTISNIISSETAWPIKAKFYVEPPWEGERKVYINGPGHIRRYVSIEGQGQFLNLAQGCVHTKNKTGVSQKLLYRSEANFV